MTTVSDICGFLERFAPVLLAEDWDNVGLLVGRGKAEVSRLMTCLTLTPESVAEAIEAKADMVVAHHPLPFRPLKTITDQSIAGGMLLDLIAGGIAVYSPHTAFDSAATGINQQLAERLELNDIQPIDPHSDRPEAGGGRIGRLLNPLPLSEFASQVRAIFQLPGMHLVGPVERDVQTVAVACGAAGVYLQPALKAGADALVTGETNFHTCLEAKAQAAGLILVGHYASERFAVEQLAEKLHKEFTHVTAWPSREECDPVQWFASQ